MALLSRFLNFIEEKKIFRKQDRVLLAVSGGKDSVLMVDFFVEAKLKFGVAHCNFKLRGTSADEDAIFVKELAEKFKVPYYSVEFDTLAYAKERGISIEMSARSLRYAWFEQIRSTYAYDYIAVAHHQNDSMETILLNITRGTGIAGLHGILPKRDYLIRPLLFLTRDEVDAEVKERKLAYRTDETNFSTVYLRNKIRLDVVPRLKEINPMLEKTFAENSERFRELEELLHEYGDMLRVKLFKKKVAGAYRIDIRALQELRPLKTLLYELFRPYHFTPEVLTDLMVSWQKEGRTGKVFYSDSHCILINRDELLLAPNQIEKTVSVELIPEKPTHFNAYRISVQFSDDMQKINEQGKVAVDADKLIFPLVVRPWRMGDSFIPLGMKGRKKLSDFFIALKIPLSEKRSIPLVVNGNGEVVWVIPYRMDNRYKITDKTKKVAILECR